MSMLQKLQRMLAFNEDMFMCTKKLSRVFHYTSPTGFESILFGNHEKTVLWASRYDCLNDSSEGTVAQELYVDICKEMLENGELRKEIYDRLVTVQPAVKMYMWRKEDGADILTISEYERYVCSFSANPDSLSMWNYYSKDNKYEGFNIGFYSSTLFNSIEKELQLYESHIGMYPIVYDRDEQANLVRDFIKNIAKCFDPGKPATIVCIDSDEEEILNYIVAKQLLQWSLVFKKDCFKHEEEVRLIVDIGIRGIEEKKKIPQMQIHYRISNGYTIPYIKLPFDKYCLSDVTIGPLTCSGINKKTQIAIMEERLSAEGYKAIVDYSVIPIRY